MSTFQPHPRPQPDPEVEFARLNRWVIRRFVESLLANPETICEKWTPEQIVAKAIEVAKEIANRCESDDPANERDC